VASLGGHAASGVSCQTEAGNGSARGRPLILAFRLVDFLGAPSAPLEGRGSFPSREIVPRLHLPLSSYGPRGAAGPWLERQTRAARTSKDLDWRLTLGP
jgi:hypothetical protein